MHSRSILRRASGLGLLVAAAFAVSFLSACSSGPPPAPDLLSRDPHASGNDQAGLYGDLLPKPLRVVVEGAQKPGLLGGKGGRPVVPDAAVRFSVVTPGDTGVFEGNRSRTVDTVTDAGGVARTRLRLGRVPGDILIEATLPEFPDVAAVHFRALAGVARIGKDLEGSTSGTIPEFGLRLVNPDGSPAEGVDVYFRVEGHADGSKVKHGRVTTGTDGRAVTSWKLGKKITRYFASVEVADERPGIPDGERFRPRAIEYEAMATSTREMFIILLGGLAVFIFGMKLMSEGLQQMADRRLRSVLHFMTQNRVMAVAAGTIITAMIQSSSATTVMTVGFVNAGLMTFTQSIGVIFGANIGTTITAQIIAFKLNALAYPAITVGLIMAGLMRRPQMRALGQAILGFGLLFLGMTTMSGVLKPLRYSPEFVEWFKLFDCTPAGGGLVPAWPALMCIVIGTATTVLVQSSSATVGLVLALSSQGLISFYTAVPLILGDNIGTTITANLAAIGANRNARRTAMAHTLFNVLGAAYMYAMLFMPFWGGKPIFLGFVDWITPGVVFTDHPENLLRHVANSHTVFNLLNVALFLPFTQTMARVCHGLIPLREADRDTVLQYLEPKLLQTPSIALAQAVKEVDYMVRKGQAAVGESCALICGGHKSLVAKITAREELIDRLQREITEYLVELSGKALAPEQASLIPALIHVVNDAERVGDHAEEMIELKHLLDEGRHVWTKEAKDELSTVVTLLDRQFETIYGILEGQSNGDIEAAYGIEREINEAVQQFTEAHVRRLDSRQCTVPSGVIYLDALVHLERVGDHLINIAERARTAADVTSV